MSLVDVVEQVGSHTPKPFIAPIPDAEVVDVFTLQDGIPYTFKLRAQSPGWWQVVPVSKSWAHLGEVPQSCDILAYLDQLPRFYAICCFRLSERTWLVVPYNASDTAQRGWPNGEPRAMHLVRHAIRPFDVVVTRSLAGTLLYEDLDTRLGNWLFTESLRFAVEEDSIEPSASTRNDFKNAYQIVYHRKVELKAEAQRQAIEKQHYTTEGKLRWQLAFMGANLESWLESGEGYKVTWSHEGERYSMRLRRDKRIASAGICLDRTDSSHNLSSIVAVMEEAKRLERFDL